MFEPADLAMKLMPEVLAPEAIVKAPVVMLELLLPEVVSKVILAAVPPVFATKAIAPVWLMIPLVIKLMFEPTALSVMAPA